MKKTLFAMLALALCGTAFGGAEFKVSECDTTLDLDSYAYKGQPITVIVDDSKTLTKVDLGWMVGSITLSFIGENTLNTGSFDIHDAGGYAVVGDSVAMTSWGEKLASATDITTIALVNATGFTYIPYTGTSFTFAGTEANQSITLGDTEMKYLGYSYFAGYNSEEFENLKNTIGANEFAIVGLEDMGAYNNGLYLVGKGSSSVPEPATATLSLLALAGLATRRKRK